MSLLGNEVCKTTFAIKSVSAKNKVQEHPLLFSIGLMSWLPCLFSLLSLNNTVRYLSWDYKLPFSLTPRIRPPEYSITFRDSWVWTKDFEGSPPQLYRVNSWNSKKYIIYLAIVSEGKRQSIITIFVSLIFRQYNNLGKGIQFNIFWSVLNRYFRLLFIKQGVPRVLKNYNIADPWNFLNSETLKRAAHKMQWWILSNNTQMWPQHISGLEK